MSPTFFSNDHAYSEQSTLSSPGKATSLQVVHLNDFTAPISLGVENSQAYTRRFATLIIDDSQTRVGGNGTIVSATNAFGEHFAIKILNGPSEHEYEVHRTVSGIQGYPRLYGKASLNDDPAFVMEWIEGEDLLRLRSRLSVDDGERLSPLTVARLGRDLFDVLARTDVLEDRIVHSDLSMRNIMVSTLVQSAEEQSESGAFDLRIIDFGSAAFEDATQTAAFATTPEFAAPELMQGERTHATDVYAASRILSILLYGNDDASTATAHSSENDVSAVLLHEPEVSSIITQVINDLIPEPSMEETRIILERIDEDLGKILRRGLEKDPAKRPSAAEMRDALSSFAQSYAANIERAFQGEELISQGASFSTDQAGHLSLRTRNRIRLIGKSASVGMLITVILITAYLIATTSISVTWGMLSLEGINAGALVTLLFVAPVIGAAFLKSVRRHPRSLLGATAGILIAALIIAWVVNAGSFDPGPFKRLMMSAVFASSIMSWCPLVLDCAFPPRSANIRKTA